MKTPQELGEDIAKRLMDPKENRIFKPKNKINFEALGIECFSRYNRVTYGGEVESVIDAFADFNFGLLKKLKELGLDKSKFLEFYEYTINNLEISENNFVKENIIEEGIADKISLHFTNNEYIYFVANVPDIEDLIMIKAHEESHILHKVEKLNLLEWKIKEISPRFKFDTIHYFPRLCDKDIKEYIAATGSAYVCHREGFNPIKQMRRYAEQSCIDAFNDYFSLLNNGKLGETKK
ncbi:MAG: hypothetical protein ACP5OG_04080 [Candidatus Nanoarchaeia archaeon]